MSKEALKMALETAEGIANANWREWHELASPEEFERWVKSRAKHMATALREALAKPDFWEGYVPEPVKPAQQALDEMAWNAKELGLDYEPAQQPFGYFKAEPFGWTDCAETDEGAVALYERPPAQRKPLTDEQMWELWNSQGDDAMEQQAAIAFARAIEAAHGIKENT